MNENNFNKIREDVLKMPVHFIKRLEKDIHSVIVREALSIKSPEDIYHNNLYKYRNKKQEHVFVLMLDGKNEVIKTHIATIGILNSSQLHPREIFVEAIKRHSASIILAHNHPSGLNTPSIEDISITKRIKEAGEIIGIKLLDHIVFSKTGFYSFLGDGKI